MPDRAMTAYVARKQLSDMLNGDADFVALRMEKNKPDDVVFHANTHGLPDDVVNILQESYGNVVDMGVRLRINEILQKYT